MKLAVYFYESEDVFGHQLLAVETEYKSALEIAIRKMKQITKIDSNIVIVDDDGGGNIEFFFGNRNGIWKTLLWDANRKFNKTENEFWEEFQNANECYKRLQ